LPTRFDVDGNALDAEGFPCHDLACPKCHLMVPRILFEVAPLFFSIVGTPSCGKSYFLASMVWQMRQTLPRSFSLSFADADPVFNRLLNHYEEVQFYNPNRDKIVRLAKTEEQGDLYDAVRYGDQVVNYPRPFMFAVRPLQNHPSSQDSARASRVICLYDNAGESFEPGKDTTANPVTRHLAQAQAILLLYDPTQDPRFRAACQGKTNDPQITQGLVSARQETVLHEMAQRIRRHTGLSNNERHPRPLIVIVTKWDAWSALFPQLNVVSPWTQFPQDRAAALEMDTIEVVSRKVRDLLWQITPEFVSNAESFAESVTYIPCSATGRSPERDPQTGQIGVRPKDVKPVWAEVPLLWTMSQWCGGLIAFRGGSGEFSRSSNGNGQYARSGTHS
jgi:hypothetical protein